jgi:hypothetical protein
MMVRNRSSRVMLRLSPAMALVLAGCATLDEHPPACADTERLVCLPSTETEIHAPGDPHWVGHDLQQLQQVLGKEGIYLDLPSNNAVLVYDRASQNCIDAYVIDSCNTVIHYYCRPVPVAPMNWGRQAPIPGPE